MVYLSQSGCSSGGYTGCHSGGCWEAGISGYLAGSGNHGSWSHSGMGSIDSIISSYSGPVASAMASETQPLQNYSPVFFDVPDSGSGYGISESINSAIYSGASTGYSSGKGNKPAASRHDNFLPELFLSRDRPASPFIGSSEDIKHYIKDAFEKTAGRMLPDDIMIRVVDQHELRQLHEEFGGIWTPGLQGISINRKGFGQSIIVVKENDLDRLMVTIGHEIGHVINFPLSDRLNEEAKAFAFEMAWLKKLYEHNIAGLKNSLNPDPRPARNGLHDVAFNFVKKQMIEKKDCFDIIKDLMANRIRVRGDDNVWM